MNTKQDEFLFHPKNVMLFMLLFGLSFLFLALTVAYVYIRVSNGVPPVQVPVLFVFNTAILLTSSWTMIRARRCYLSDDTGGYQQNLKLTIWLSLFFTIMQGVAWWWLFQNNIHLGTSTTTSFLYVISFVHLAHVLGLSLRLLTLYWHFLDGLWIYLVLFFAVNQLL